MSPHAPIPLPDVDEAVIAYGAACEERALKRSPRAYAEASEAYKKVLKARKERDEALRADDQATIQMQAAVIAELRGEISRLKTGAVA